jgi:GTPase SAR1 family protein
VDRIGQPTTAHGWDAAVKRSLAWLEASDAQSVRVEAADIRDRLSRWQVTVAVIGQFKRGKSSLINAWIGQDLLPVGILPTTGTVVRIRAGARERAVVRFADGSQREIPVEEVGLYVDEASNPANRLGVRDVLIETSGLTLPAWLEIVDTPGIGSTVQGASEAARAYLPWVDLAVFVLSPETPITADERQYLVEAGQHAVRWALVMTKCDIADANVVETMTEFALREIEHATGVRPPVVHLSTMGAEARRRARAALEALIEGEAVGDVVRAATVRRLMTFIQRERSLLSLRLAAWRSPLDERQQRRNQLLWEAARLSAARDDSATLWAAARRDAAADLDARLAAHRSRILADLAEQARTAPVHDLQAALVASGRARLQTLRYELREAARQIAAEVVERRASALRQQAAQIADASAGSLGVGPLGFDLSTPILEAKAFYFQWDEDPSLLASLGVDRLATLLPGRLGERTLRARALSVATELVERNLGRLGYAVRTSLDDVLHAAWKTIDGQLQELAAALDATLEILSRPPSPDEARVIENLGARLAAGEALQRELDGLLAAVATPAIPRTQVTQHGGG